MKRNIFHTLFSAGRKFLAAALLLISISSFAANPDEISDKVSSDFAAHFKNAANVNWTVTDLYSKASFDWLNEKLNVYYNDNGNFYCLSKDINTSELPANAQKNITEKFAGSVITQAIEMDKPRNETEYYVSLESAKASTILKITAKGNVSVFSKTNK